MQLQTWPDHLPPTNRDSIKKVIEFVDNGKSLGPVVVHCSAGNGRTGCMIAIYNIYQCLKVLKQINEELQQSIKPFFSVFNICRKLREQRQGMISSSDQYQFVYEYCAELAKGLFFS